MKNYRGTYKYGGRTSLYVSHHNPLGFTAALPAYTGQRSSPHSMCFYFWCNFKTSSVAPDKQSSHGLNRVELATFVFCFKFLCQSFFYSLSMHYIFSLFSWLFSSLVHMFSSQFTKDTTQGKISPSSKCFEYERWQQAILVCADSASPFSALQNLCSMQAYESLPSPSSLTWRWRRGISHFMLEKARGLCNLRSILKQRKGLVTTTRACAFCKAADHHGYYKLKDLVI